MSKYPMSRYPRCTVFFLFIYFIVFWRICTLLPSSAHITYQIYNDTSLEPASSEPQLPLMGIIIWTDYPFKCNKPHQNRSYGSKDIYVREIRKRTNGLITYSHTYSIPLLELMGASRSVFDGVSIDNNLRFFS